MSETTKASTKDYRKKRRLLFSLLPVVLIVLMLVMFVVVYYCGLFDSIIYAYNGKTYSIKAISREQLSIHFLQMVNGANGDCIYIRAGDTDILIDAGSKRDSAEYIGDYVDRFCTDGKLEYVIVTHADTDHLSGFVGTSATPGIFDRYECETIIQFARTNKNSQVYYDYCAKRNDEISKGANCYTALECYREINGAKRVYELADGITMTVLYQEYYETYSERENNYSVCLLFSQEYKKGGKTETNHYLLLGDLEKAGEQSLVKNNPDLPEVVLYKGSHHGSRTSSNNVLLSKIKPQIVCICCVTGSVENTQNVVNTFPSQSFINRISLYTDRIYATNIAIVDVDEETGEYVNVGCDALNGDIVCACTDGKVRMYFSNNDTKLCDTDWFAENRVYPASWQ